MQPLFLKLFACVAAVLVGLFLFGLGLVIAFIAGSDWLYMSLAGVFIAIVAGFVLVRQTHRFKRTLTHTARMHVRARLRK